MVLVQALDHSLYMARTVERGDFPIQRYRDGEFHVEGDLVLAGKDRQYMVFNIILPVLRKLLGRNVVFITPGPRYLDGCCDEPEHAPNRLEDGFEADLRKCLAECRQNYKDFLFTKSLRGFRVVDPSPALPRSEEIRDWDPVHPTTEGYERVCDLMEAELEKFLSGGVSKKRPAESQLGQDAKKWRTEVPRPSWVVENNSNAQRNAGRGFRGRGGWFGPGRPWRGNRGFRGGFRGGRRGS